MDTFVSMDVSEIARHHYIFMVRLHKSNIWLSLGSQDMERSVPYRVVQSLPTVCVREVAP